MGVHPFFWFLQVCAHHHHAYRELQKHEGLDTEEPIHAAQDQQFCSGKFSPADKIARYRRVNLEWCWFLPSKFSDSAHQWAPKGLAGEEEQSWPAMLKSPFLQPCKGFSSSMFDAHSWLLRKRSWCFVFITDDKAIWTGLQGEGRKDGVQGSDLSEELPDDPGGSISFPVGYLKNTSLSHPKTTKGVSRSHKLSITSKSHRNIKYNKWLMHGVLNIGK